jgi:uncharacterized RmlC-like cupin family protein
MAIDVDEELGTATARSYVTVFQALSDLPLQPIAAGRYEDRFGRSDGQWAFVQRRILIRLTGHLGHHLRAVGRDAGDSMAEQTPAAVRVVRPGQASEGQQGLTYFAGVSAQTAGSTGLCLHRPVIPPGGRAHAHRHTGHESAIYLLDGEVRMFWGEDLRQQAVMSTGDFAYIPPGVPHLPVNLSSTGPATALVARTDPNEQESVVLLPDLDGLPHLWTVPDIGGLPSGPRSCR